MIRRLLACILQRGDDATPTAAESLTYARQAIRAAERTLNDAWEWTQPPMGPASRDEEYTLARVTQAIDAARDVLQEVSR